MPGIASNTVYECGDCGGKFDFEDATGLTKPCPICGGQQFLQVRIVTVCDFCGDTLGEIEPYSYPCKPFMYGIIVSGMPDGGSKGDWAACMACHELIEADDQEGLIERSLEVEHRIYPDRRPERHISYALVKQIQKGFFANRDGPMYRGEPPPERRE